MDPQICNVVTILYGNNVCVCLITMLTLFWSEQRFSGTSDKFISLPMSKQTVMSYVIIFCKVKEASFSLRKIWRSALSCHSVVCGFCTYTYVDIVSRMEIQRVLIPLNLPMYIFFFFNLNRIFPSIESESLDTSMNLTTLT